MADFQAIVKAILDTTGLQDQLNKLRGTVKVDVDAGSAEKGLEKVNKKVSLLQKTLNFGSVAALTAKSIQLISKASREAVQSVKDINKALTELKKVTDETDATYKNFLSGASSDAKKIGTTISGLVKSTADFARLGYSFTDAQELAKVANIFAVVGDEINGVDGATSNLISTMAAFKIGANEAITIIDKYNEVSNNFAISSGGIGSAIERSGASLAAANNTLDESIALITAANTVVQSPESVGTAFKTMSMRIRGAKTELEEAGLDTAGMAKSVSSLREEILALSGVDIMLDENTFKSTYQIMDELSAKWKDLTDIQQASITELIAGKRQGNIVSSLMENFDIARSALKTSLNAEGSAMSEHAKWLDSIEAKTNQLKASFESLSMNTLSADLVGGLIEGATAITSFLDKTNLLKSTLVGLSAFGAIKGFTVISAGISDAAMRLNEFNAALNLVKTGNVAGDQLQQLAQLTANLSQSQLKAVLSSQALSTQQRLAILSAQGMSTAEAEAALASMGLATAQNTATASTLSLGGALKGLWATLKANPLILVVAAVTAATSVYFSYKQKQDEIKQASLEAGNAAKDEAKNIQNLYVAYQEANSAYQSNTGSKEGLESATEGLLTALGYEQGQIEALIAEYGDLDAAIDGVTKKSLKEKASKILGSYDAAKEDALDAASDTTLFGYGSAIQVSTHGDAKKFAQVLADAGYISTMTPWSAPIETGINDSGSYEDLVTNYNRLLDMQQELESGIGTLYSSEELSEAKVYNDISSKIESVGEKIQAVNEITDSYNNIKAQLAYMDYVDQNGVPETKEQYEALKQSLLDSSDASGVFIGSQEQIEASIIDTLATIPELSDFVDDYSGTLSETETSTELTLDQIKEKVQAVADETNKFVSNISAVQDVLSSQSAGKSISIDDFNSEELKDYRSALELTNGALQLNADKVNEIVKTKSEELIAINNTEKALAQTDYLKNAKEIERYRKELRESTTLTEDARNQIEENIDSLLAENSAIADKCTELNLLSASLQEATSAYQHWLNAQNAADYGDMASDAVGAIQRIQNTYNSESDIFGDFGSKKFDAAVEFIIPDSVSPDDLSAIESYMTDFQKYLTFDKNGNTTGLNIDQFLSDSVEAGLMSYSEDDGFKILGGKKMEDFAEGLELSSGVVQAFFDELQLKGAEFDWSDETVKTFGDLAVEANEAAEALRNVFGDDAYKIKMDVSDLATEREQVAALEATIAEMDEIKAKPEVDTQDIDNANAVIQYCLRQKQLLSQPDIMRVDASQVEGELGNAISLLQQFQNAQNDLEILSKVGADTSEAQSKIDSLTTEIQNLSPTIKADLQIDSTSADAIQNSISALSADTISLHVDASAISGYNPESKTCDVIYNPDTDALPQSFDSIERTVTYKADTSGLPGAFSTVTRYVNYVKTGKVSVNGTAHASGTAKAGGDWGTAKGGKTLVGEVGYEILVNPHTGKWYTVGDNGAEFVDVPKDAIVFNHSQSKSLLENGYVSGRASALVSGTAMVSGSYKPYKPGGTATKDYHNPAGAAPNSTSSSKSNSDELETIDWIEIAISRIQRAVDKLKDIASSAFKSLKTKLGATYDGIEMINKELSIQQKAYDRYIKEANSVGLSSELANLVKNGAIDISQYDLDTQKKIKEYQEWYEKALDASDAVSDLHKQIAQYHKDSFDDAQDDADNQIKAFDHLISMAESKSDLLKEQGYMDSAKIYESLMQTESRILQKLQQGRADLQKHFNDAMASGEIEEGSEAWYDMKNAIDKVDESIAEANLDLVKYENTIQQLHWEYFDYLQERISKVNDEADFLIDLLGESDLFNENGSLNENGLSIAGLHTQKYNTYMAQADAYAKEIRDIDSELANDPNNQTLIERREELLDLQQKSILSAEDEKQAIVELSKQGIDAQIASMKELIDKYKETLDSAKNLYDYQKKVNKQSENIANIEKQLSAYANDTSEEARAKVQKLQDDLKSAQDELQETEYQQYVSEQKEMLDALSSEYEEVLNQRLDDVDALISETIDAVNANSSAISETISQAAENVGYSLSDNFRNIWSGEGFSIYGVVSMYGNDFGNKLTNTNTILGNIYTAVYSMISASDEIAVKKYAKGGMVNYTGLAQVDGTPSKPESFLDATDTKNIGELKDFLRKLGSEEIRMLGNTTNFDYAHLAQLPITQITLQKIPDVIRKPSAPEINNSTNITFGDIRIDHIEDYNDFVRQLQKDKTFERMIQAMTAGRMMGCSSMSKYKNNWG